MHASAPAAAAATPSPETITKTEFADRIGRSQGRISQYIREGTLHGPALVGEGRRQRIHVATALRQLAQLNPAHQTGQGKPLITAGAAPSDPATDPAPRPPRTDTLDPIAAQAEVEALRRLRAQAAAAEIAAAKAHRIEQAQAGAWVEAKAVDRRIAALLDDLLRQVEQLAVDAAEAAYRAAREDQGPKAADAEARRLTRRWRARRAKAMAEDPGTEPVPSPPTDPESPP